MNLVSMYIYKELNIFHLFCRDWSGKVAHYQGNDRQELIDEAFNDLK